MPKKKQEKEESKKRWDFIEKASKEVDDWPEWKKAEISCMDQGDSDKVRISSGGGTPKIEFN